MTITQWNQDGNCDNCSAICDKTMIHEGRWYYECQTFTGDLRQFNEITIVWESYFWHVVVDTSAQEWIDDNGSYFWHNG